MIKRNKSNTITIAAATAFLVSTSSALIAENTATSGPTILTISGAMDASEGDTVSFDLDAMSQIGATTFTTTTIWTDGAQTFTGVPLIELIATVGGNGTTARATAINDYAVEIDLNDSSTKGAIVAYHLNGEPMSVRDKGPLWVVYPYDSDPSFRSEVVYARSIWQLDRVEIIE